MQTQQTKTITTKQESNSRARSRNSTKVTNNSDAGITKSSHSKTSTKSSNIIVRAIKKVSSLIFNAIKRIALKITSIISPSKKKAKNSIPTKEVTTNKGNKRLNRSHYKSRGGGDDEDEFDSGSETNTDEEHKKTCRSNHNHYYDTKEKESSKEDQEDLEEKERRRIEALEQCYTSLSEAAHKIAIMMRANKINNPQHATKEQIEKLEPAVCVFMQTMNSIPKENKNAALIHFVDELGSLLPEVPGIEALMGNNGLDEDKFTASTVLTLVARSATGSMATVEEAEKQDINRRIKVIWNLSLRSNSFKSNSSKETGRSNKQNTGRVGQIQQKTIPNVTSASTAQKIKQIEEIYNPYKQNLPSYSPYTQRYYEKISATQPQKQPQKERQHQQNSIHIGTAVSTSRIY